MKSHRFLSALPSSSPKSLAGEISVKRRKIVPPPPPPPLPQPQPQPHTTPSPPPPPRSTKNPPLASSRPNPPQRSLTPAAAPDVGVAREWETLPLPLPRSELSLPLTLPTGQTFRWRRTAPSSFTGVVGRHLFSLRHLEDDPSGCVAFLLHNPPTEGSAAAAAPDARAALCDYLNLGVSLTELWRGFADADPRFAELAGGFDGGARILRQDPLECLFQFLCSSNNNIGRIEKMVGVLSSFGEYLGTVGGFDFHEFPSLERLAAISEQQLREAGFGYRAKYIIGTVRALQSKPGGGNNWLVSLRGLELHEVVDSLCSLPGVGPKVAACIALFSLDQHHAIPVDTHVWQIATRYLIPELAGMKLTPKLCNRVADAFETKFGKYAGWAQNVLFIGELSPQKATVESSTCKSQQVKPAKEKASVKKVVGLKEYKL